MNVAELFALIGFEFDDSSEKKFDDKLDGFAGRLGDWADKSAAFMGKAFAAFFLQDLYNIAKAGVDKVVALLNPAEVFNMAEAQAAVLDETAKQARALNVTTEALQRHRFIAGQNGIAQQQFEASIAKTTRAVGEANNKNQEFQKTFRGLGLSYRALGKMSAEARFDKVLEALAGIDDETKRAALGAKLFGDEAFPKFASLLKGGTEGLKTLRAQADALGFIVSDEDAQKAEAFNDALDRTTRAAGALKDRALNPLFGPLTRLLKALEDFIVQNRDVLQLPFDAFASAFAFGFNLAADAVIWLTTAVKAARPVLAELLDRLGGVNGLLKWATILTIAFGAAWAWTNRTTVLLFLQRLAVELAVLAVRLVLAAESAFLFLKNLTLASAWAAIKAGFARLIALLSTTTAQFLLLALFIGAVLLVLEDFYTFFDGGKSQILGEWFQMDPNSQADLQAYYDTLLLIGLALGVILALLTGIPGLIAIALVLVAYLAANWDTVVDAVANMFVEVGTFFYQLGWLIGNWASEVADDVADVFWSILDTISEVIKGVLDDIAAIPGKARSIISRLPGADLLGLGGGEIVANTVGGGAANPNVDRAARVFQARNSRSVNIQPTIEVKVDAKDRTANEAADIFKGSVFDELFRELDSAYDGDEQ